MILNDEQKAAVRYDGSCSIAACPGSGKTRVIIAKMIRCVDDIRETPRRIACVTYTHAAVSAIEDRLQEFGESEVFVYCEICTIHSFCLNNILRPFYYLLPELSEGFRVFPPDSEEWRRLTKKLAEKYSVNRRHIDDFSRIQREPCGHLFVPTSIPDAAASKLVTYLDANSLVTFPDIVFHSFRLMEAHPFISRGVASRFAWMLIDEFQDTSVGQVAILRNIAKYRKTRFFFVGDLNQSIMAFAGAHPKLMRDFPIELQANTDMQLSGNYRCSRKIVDDAESLLPMNPRMRAVGEWKDFDSPCIHIHTTSLAEGILDHFLPVIDSFGIPLGQAAVLAPWWTTLYSLGRELRKRGIPVRGPGARPYRYSNLFAGFAEALCAYVEQQDVNLFKAAQRMLFIMLLNTTGNPVWRVYSYEGRKCLCSILTSVKRLRDQEESAISLLRNASHLVANFLVNGEFITSKQSAIIPESAEGMIDNIIRNRIDPNNLHISDLALFAQPNHCLRLLTMHGSKGLEFDAVAIVDLHEGKVPDFRAIKDDNVQAIKEDRRQLYVAITRARKLLIYITDSSNPKNHPSRFLNEMGIV